MNNNNGQQEFKSVDTKKILETTEKKEVEIKNKQDTVYTLVKSLESQIKAALPKHINTTRFCRIIMTELRKNPELLKCNSNSLMGAILTASQLGLEPGILGQCYFVPFKQNVEFIIGVQGLVNLLYNNGNIETVSYEIVYENDTFERLLGLRPSLIHKINDEDNRGAIRGCYAVINFKNGSVYYKYMTKKDILKRKEVSKSKGSEYSPWNKWEEEMYVKTVIKGALKYCPLKTEIQEMINNDHIIKNPEKENILDIDEKDTINVDFNNKE
jgi:recombination protein RecT